MTPPPHVVRAFGGNGAPTPLPGGQGRSFRVGSIVLKFAERPIEELEWEADVLGRVVQDGFRVALPVRSRDGRLVVDGWHAVRFVHGAHARGKWAEIIRAGESLHAGLAGEQRPAFLDRRSDAWAIADRVAWDDAPIDPYLRLPFVGTLAAARRSVKAHDQLIHGDLSGNVLFADGLPPAIIDLAPYWRPAAYGSAIVVADALVWEGADASLLAAVRDVAEFDQLLVRGLLFRFLSERDPAATAAAYAPAVALAGELARTA